MSMKETTFKFDAERIASRAMAISALEAVKTGNCEQILGSNDMTALKTLAASHTGRLAAMLRPFATDYSPDELSLTLLTSEESDPTMAFRLLESALTAYVAGNEAEGDDLTRSALRQLRFTRGLRLRPTW